MLLHRAIFFARVLTRRVVLDSRIIIGGRRRIVNADKPAAEKHRELHQKLQLAERAMETLS